MCKNPNINMETQQNTSNNRIKKWTNRGSYEDLSYNKWFLFE